MPSFRSHQFLWVRGQREHSFTPSRQWLTTANILITLEWMRLQHGTCNYAGIFCATQGMLMSLRAIKHRAVLWVPQEAPHCSGDGKLIFLQLTAHWVCEEQSLLLWLRDFLEGNEGNCLCAITGQKADPGAGFPATADKKGSWTLHNSSSKPELPKSECVTQDLSLKF